MTDLLIGLGLIGIPAALLWGFWRLRPSLERGSGTVDPLTGALYFGAEARGREGLKSGG
ncbi:hypothetical protein L1280_000076 [Deinococcus sp. HSC-46F16]|uniref:hypothetical protein n=1 Tax=Deinococcus sp. HSC-46F16 TaxID=2910968 RepID=UPI0020A00544|nr:hypothetical protein [Deinococcus sp. HSC-46F16]MCP2012948.1 hypothetical protein [Deinococcus sp. HSC-46F16]